MRNHKRSTKQRPEYATEGVWIKLQVFMGETGKWKYARESWKLSRKKNVLGTTVSLDHFSVLCNRAVARQQMIRNCCIQQAGLKYRTFGFPSHLTQCFLSLGRSYLEMSVKGGCIQLAYSFNSHDISVLNLAIKIFFECVCVCNVNSCLQVVFHLVKYEWFCRNGRPFSWIFHFCSLI